MNTRRFLPIRPLAGAGGVTFSLLWLLGILNADVPIPTETRDDIRTMIIDGIAAESPSESRNEPETTADSMQPIELSLELPTLETPRLDAPNLEFDFPSPVVTAMAPMAANRIAANSASAGSSQSTASSTQPPRESHGNKRPRYPAHEKQLRIEGSVYVLLLIDETGRVSDLKFVDGPESFRQSVNEVAWEWTFTPALRNGRPVKVWAPKRVRFDPANES